MLRAFAFGCLVGVLFVGSILMLVAGSRKRWGDS